MRVKKGVRITLILILILIFLIILFPTARGSIDYLKVMILHDKPLFAIKDIGADDGGSGTYIGKGYSFEIKGKFLEFDDYYGVTKATFYIFDYKISSYSRN